MTLYIISTPIGNLGDITYRAVQTLEEVDFIATEDTRVSSKLLNHFEIKKPLVSYFEHNKREKGKEIIDRMLKGETCGIITDAGTPAISDPGEDLVKLCFENGIKVVPVVGASAIASAISVSGQPSARFTFEGFLSVDKKARFEHLESLKNEKRTMVFYEAPHKLKKTLNDFYEVFGNRDLTICREMTKKYEEYIKTNLNDAIRLYKEKEPRGEYALVIRGNEEQEASVDENECIEKVLELVNYGMSIKDAVKYISKENGISKNLLYNSVIKKQKVEGK
ncbi:MAG: 16S rRNA (cytidine(1402)-2'-O)-methyltransferase [Clostridia bacterium]